jgi:hypothetical protein
VDNRITFQNLASGDVFVNFLGSLTRVPAGQTVNLTELPKGIFNYETTYEIPSNATSSSTSGALAGEMELSAGTKILIVYSSTFIDGVYTIFATFSSSDDLTEEEDPNPIGP